MLFNAVNVVISNELLLLDINRMYKKMVDKWITGKWEDGQMGRRASGSRASG
jgi:hypothetical protein